VRTGQATDPLRKRREQETAELDDDYDDDNNNNYNYNRRKIVIGLSPPCLCCPQIYDSVYLHG
jgi:hypothetical protein